MTATGGVMFDARNKGQPKLVYARVPQRDSPKTDQQPLPAASNFQAPLSTSNNLQDSLPQSNNTSGSSRRDDSQRQLFVFNDMQNDKEQSKSNQQSSQFQTQQHPHGEMRQNSQQHQKQQHPHGEMRQNSQQHQKQQHPHGEMRQNSQQHQLNVTVVDVVASKKQQSLKGSEFYKIPMQDSGGKNAQTDNSKFETYAEMKVFRSSEYETGSEKRLVNEKLQTSSSSSGQTADNEKKLSASTSGIRPEHINYMNTKDTNNANFLRHPRTQSDSSATPNRSPTLPQSPNQYASPQQFMHYQQHQSPKQQQEIHKDILSHQQDRRPRPDVVRVRSYPAGRQAMPTTLHSASVKPTNLGQPWSIPRVSTATRPHSVNVTRHDDSGLRSPPTATRPHSLTLPASRHDDNGLKSSPAATRPHSLTVPSARHDDSSLRSTTAHHDFSTYNPSASPRALRLQGRPHNQTITRQLSSPSPSSSSSSSSHTPKSILKPTTNQEQPDVFFNSRPLLLPRAHSERGNTYVPRDFDFSSILTTNKDILSVKVPTIQVTSQSSDHTATSNSRQSLPRPLSANAGLTDYELKTDGRPMRKSVTFNSLVQLLHEDRVSTVRSLPVDA